MYKVVYTRKFLKNLEKHSRSGVDFKVRLIEVIELLGAKSPLPQKYKDHKLNGEWDGYRECHILFDLLLVYKYYEHHIELITLDTHEALF